MINTKIKKINFPSSFLENIDIIDSNLFKKSVEPYLNKHDEFKINHKFYSLGKEKLVKSSNKIKALSFFSGAGGLDIGAHFAGVDSISCLDFDKDCIETLKSNFFYKDAQLMHEDISNISAAVYKDILKKNKPEKLILIGGPPCQPFSKAGYWITNKKRKAADDPRNMIGQYLRIVNELKPDGFILENVESIMHPSNIEAVESLENEVIKMGYNMQILKLNAADYGVPQKRKRVFFLVTKKRIEVEPIKTHFQSNDLFNDQCYSKTIDWIGPFNINKYSEEGEFLTNKTYFEQLISVPPGKNYFKVPRALKAKGGIVDNKRFWSFLLKLHPLLPSWTIAAQPGPWTGPFHWEGRRLRLLESAAIQTFPSDYKFYGSRHSIQKQIGNAVPPLLAKVVLEHLIKHI
ncbi:DNA cytosine methyltransferase [Gammaproteobacteria bacterium]|nr:DNA cytosine methyltransferase [Gammaproteobacteria bacterium]